MRDANESGGFDLDELARRIGAARWAEMQLFETLGRWVPTVPELDVKLRLAAHSAHHAWHAELWDGRLPERTGVTRDELVRPANDEIVAFVAALSEPQGPELTIEKLVGAYRVFVPRFVAAYSFHLDRTSELTDASTVRALTFMLQDELADWREGERLLQSLIRSPAEVDRALAHQGRLERLMVAAGGITGPGSVGSRPDSV